MGRPARGDVAGGTRWARWLGWPAHVALAVLALAAVTPVTLSSYRNDLEAGRRTVAQVASLKAAGLAAWFEERRASARLSGTSFPQAGLYLAWQRDGDAESRDLLYLRLSQFAEAGGFSGVTLLDPAGRVLWSTGAHRYVQGEAHDVGGRALEPGGGVVEWSYRDEQGAMHIDFVVALPVEGDDAGPSVVYHSSPADMLSSPLTEWSTASPSGGIVVARPLDVEVHTFWLEGADGGVVVRDAIVPIEGSEMLIIPVALEAAGGALSVREGRDREGTRVIAAGHEAGGTGWVVVARIDRSEVLAGVVPTGVAAALAAVVLYLAAAVALFWLRRQQQAAVARGAEAAEAERQHALRLLAAVADTSPDAIFAKDLEGRYTLVNRSAAGFLGLPAADVLGRTDRELFPEEAETIQDNDRATVDQRGVATFEERVTTAAGPRVFLATKGPLADDAGRVTGTFGISRDITERRQAGEALAEQARTLRSAMDDLERFNRVLVDREIAMVGLKRRVNAYAARLGEQPPFLGEAVDAAGDADG